MILRNYTGAFNTALLIEQIRAAFPELINRDQEAIVPYSGNRFFVYPSMEDPTHLGIGLPDDFTSLDAFDALVAAHDPTQPTQDAITRNKIVSLAQSAVGVALKDLTAAQIKAIMAYMLFRMDGVDPVTMTIKSLDQW